LLAERITLVPQGRVPLAEQIYRQIRDLARHGRLPSGMALPSSRALAGQLGVSRNTVSAAYDLLRAEDLVITRPGAVAVLNIPATFALTDRRVQTVGRPVSLAPAGHALSAPLPATVEGARLRPGRPDPRLFPRDAWARALRRAGRTLSGDALLYGDSHGLAALRRVLARTLAETRGLHVDPEHLLILPTVRAGLGLLARCLCADGDSVWLEEPGYPGAMQAFGTLRRVALPVDGNGADVSAMPQGAPRLIYVTPSHQYPTGTRMSLSRRLALVARARECGALVVEDDYDSEFLWSGRPVPALGALAEAGEVATLGTVAKSLLPGLRLAWLAAPPHLAPALIRAQTSLGLMANVHAQAALADFMDGGQYRRHLERISRVYRNRGETLRGALLAHCGNHVAIPPLIGGLHMAVRFAPGVDDVAVSTALGQAGFGVPPLSQFYQGRGSPGLVVAFAQADEATAREFATRLARLLA